MERPYRVKLVAIAEMETKEPQYYIAEHETALPFVPVPKLHIVIRGNSADGKTVFPASAVHYDFDENVFAIYGFFDNPQQVKDLIEHSGFGPGSAIAGRGIGLLRATKN